MSRSAEFEKRVDVVHRSVRVFPVTGITVGELTEQLNSGCPLNDISLVQVVLARKNGTREVTAIGGVQKLGESLVDAARTRVFEKTLLTREAGKMDFEHFGRGYAGSNIIARLVLLLHQCVPRLYHSMSRVKIWGIIACIVLTNSFT